MATPTHISSSLLCVCVWLSPALSQTDTQTRSSSNIHDRQRREERDGDGDVTWGLPFYSPDLTPCVVWPGATNPLPKY